MKKDDKLKEIVSEKTLEEKVKEEEQLVVELQEEIEKEKIENKELTKENRKLRFFNSFLQILLFLLFVIVVFVGGWYFGTKLAEWENDNINGYNNSDIEKNDEEKNPEENKDVNDNEDVDYEISFSKTEAANELDEVFGSYLSIYGLNATRSQYMDLYNEKYDKLAIVPLTNIKVDSNSSYSYVTYEEYKSAYKSFYGNTDNLDKELKMYPDDIYPYLRKDGNVYFQVASDVSYYENSFIPEKIMYTAIDKTYTMTGIYAETNDYGDAVTANFELKYKIDVNGNKYVVGMKITKK